MKETIIKLNPAKLFYSSRRRKLIAKLFKDSDTNSVTSAVYKWIQKHRNETAAIIALLVLAKLFYTIAVYNTFNNLWQEVNNAKADIEGCIQMRENMIPQLINAVSDFVKHEDMIFFHSADVRAESINPGRPVGQNIKPGPGKLDAGKGLDLISKIFAVAEQYPELKTSESFTVLMSKAADAENEILNKRIVYNAKAQELNKRLTSFPGRMYAWMFGFKPAEYFVRSDGPEYLSQNIME